VSLAPALPWRRAVGGERLSEAVTGWLLVLPACVFLIAFTHLPAIATLVDSLYSTPRGVRAARFVGIDNYIGLFTDPVFQQALWNNLVYAVVTIPVSIGLALLMALACNAALPGRALLRMAYFTPTMLPLVAVANIWLFFYTPDYGLFDQFARLIGLSRHNWLGESSTALPALIVVAVWKEAGFFSIFYLAALQTIPPHLRDAGSLEGASRWYFFRRITWPLLAPTTLFVAVNAIINAVRLVDHVVVMTRGGPDNATMLLLYYVFEQGFRFWDTATAAAATVVLIVLMALVALAQFALSARHVHYR
jgi:sn-glycerol 3-phosphate transport system permease protein